MHFTGNLMQEWVNRADLTRYATWAIMLGLLLPKGGFFMLEKLKNSLTRYFSNGTKNIFILLLMAASLVMTISTIRKTINISIDGRDMEVVTYRSELQDVLHEKEIILGPKDKITPRIDSKVKEGDRIVIEKAVNIEVAVDGAQRKLKSAEKDVAALLQTEGIPFYDKDKISPPLTTPIKEGLKVVITRVDSKIITESKPIDFSTIVKKDDNLEKGVTKVLEEGQAGERLVSTHIIYEDGKEVSREVIKDEIAKEPVQKVLAMGTLGVIRPSRGGKAYYTRSMVMKATAYTAGYESTGKRPGDRGYGKTASGTMVKRNADGYSTIAVDPRVIPIGTRLYVEGYGFAVAEDTGGAIKGNIIDVYFPTVWEAKNWGVKRVKVYVLK
jgi:uncharacterized protein YabE (DUF348 family)